MCFHAKSIPANSQAFRKFANRREIAAAPVNLQELRIRGISCEFAAGREIARSAAISPWRDIAADPRIRSGREFAADPRIRTKPNLQMELIKHRRKLTPFRPFFGQIWEIFV